MDQQVCNGEFRKSQLYCAGVERREIHPAIHAAREAWRAPNTRSHFLNIERPAWKWAAGELWGIDVIFRRIAMNSRATARMKSRKRIAAADHSNNPPIARM